VVLKKVVQ